MKGLLKQRERDCRNKENNTTTELQATDRPGKRNFLLCGLINKVLLERIRYGESGIIEMCFHEIG